MYKKLKVIIDADDVLLQCNSYALELLTQEKGSWYDLSEITGWGLLGKPLDERMKYFKEPSFYQNQPVIPGARQFLCELMKKATIMISTSVAPQFMGERISRLMRLFPEFPPENIIMGERKEMIYGDVLLDDGLHNLYQTKCSIPVAFDRPWNKATGLCRVSNYQDFLTLIDFLNGDKSELSLIPKIFCIVGPSGSRKHYLADLLSQVEDFERIYTYSTARNVKKSFGHYCSEQDFEWLKKSGRFLESTFYGGNQYGIISSDIRSAFDRQKHAVAVMDISGCLAVYNAFPGQCCIIYAEREKRDCIMSILEKPGLSRSQITDRLVSYDMEERYKSLADMVISTDDRHLEDAIKAIHNFKLF